MKDKIEKKQRFKKQNTKNMDTNSNEKSDYVYNYDFFFQQKIGPLYKIMTTDTVFNVNHFHRNW